MRRDLLSSAIVAAAIYLVLALLLGFTAHMPDYIWEKALRLVLSPGYLGANALINMLAGRADIQLGPRMGFLFLLSSVFDIAIYSGIVLLVRRVARTLQRSTA
jgi:hypothetical protein